MWRLVTSCIAPMNSHKTKARAFALVLVLSLAGCSGGDKPSAGSALDTAPQSAEPGGRKLAQATVTATAPDAATRGAWSTVANWPLVALHAALLPDGRVLTYGTTGDGTQTGKFIYDVWSPEEGLGAASHLTLPNYTGTDLFCSAQLVLPGTGNVLLAGGDRTAGAGSNNVANADINVFETSSAELVRLPRTLNRVRWYPTMTTLSDGRVLIQGGATQFQPNKAPVLTPEVYTPGKGFVLLLDATSLEAYGGDENRWWYPRAWVASDGRVFTISGRQMYYVDASGTGKLTMAGLFAGPNNGATSTAVMYRPGLILQAGGGDYSNGASGRPGSTQSSVIDIRSGSPVVSGTGAMAYGRHWGTSTVLADGTVMVSGGASGNNYLEGVAYAAERWNPATGAWTTLASAARPRLYHSAALLLPDASVLVSGGGSPGPTNEPNAEIYYPPYLYTSNGTPAERPAIDSAPQVAGWGQSIALGVRSNSAISRVTLVRTGSVTHSFNMDQRFIEASFATAGDTVNVTLPASRTEAPPGHYMVFVHNAAGVPSVARIVRLFDETTAPSADVTEVHVAAGLQDGGFESAPNPPADGWTVFNAGQALGRWRVTAGTVDVQRYEHAAAGSAGSGGLQHVDLSGNGPGQLEQDVTGLIAGQRYALTFGYARHPFAGRTTARVRIASLDRTWSATNAGNPVAETTKGWYGARFEFTAGTVSETLIFNGLDAGALGMLIDDVAITPLGKSLLANGDFEAGPAAPVGGWTTVASGGTIGPWVVTAGSVDVTDNGHWGAGWGTESDSGSAGGSHHIDLNGSDYGSIAQTVGGLIPGKRYLVSWRHAVHPLATAASARVSIAGVVANFIATNKGNVQWTSGSLTFTASAAQHTLVMAGTDGPSYLGVLVDDVTVIPVGVAQLSSDPGFDDAPPVPTGGWTTYSAGQVFGAWRVAAGTVDLTHNRHGNPLPMGDGAGGRHYLDLNSNGVIAQQVGALVPGRRYAVGFDYSLHDTAKSGTVTIQVGSLNRTVSIAQAGNVWKRARFTFTATSANPELTLSGGGGSPAGSVLVDNVKVTALPGQPE